jgi:hypothetical protein
MLSAHAQSSAESMILSACAESMILSACSMAALILAGRKYNSPKLDVQQKNLLNFIDQPAMNYFRLGLPQAMAFKEIKILCNSGWK